MVIKVLCKTPRERSIFNIWWCVGQGGGVPHSSPVPRPFAEVTVPIPGSRLECLIALEACQFFSLRILKQ